MREGRIFVKQRKLNNLIDRGAFLTRRIKQDEEELDDLKDQIREYGKQNKQRAFMSDLAVCFLSPQSYTELDSTALWTRIKDLKLLLKLTKPNMTLCRKHFGQMFKEIATITRDNYAKVSFRYTRK